MTKLLQRTLGRTGLSVTVLGFGAMDLGGPPAANAISDSDAKEVLNAVLDGGINFIDTAGCYGSSEARIGQAISARRDEFVLATKCGCIPGQGMGVTHAYDSTNIRAGIEHSLRSMKTDRIDVAQFHGSLTRPEWEASGALDELLKLKKEGKVRFIGISGILPNLREQIASGVFDVFQVPYSAVQREHEQVLQEAADSGAGVIVRGGVARGAPGDWNKRYYMLTGEEMSGRWEAARLDELLDGASRMEFMLRFAISLPALDTAIIGTKNLAHLRENIVAASKGPLPADLVAEAKRRLDGTASKPVSAA